MHSIDLKNYGIRTDLIIEKSNIEDYSREVDKYGDILVERLSNSSNKYVSISFNDITDKDNYSNVLKSFSDELNNFTKEFINKNILVIGLGNCNSTPDSLGPKVCDNILVTRYLFSLGSVESGYSCVSIFKPGVFGNTGIETSEIISNITSGVSSDLVIIVDSLAASSIERVNKVIQITDSGIHPGSGVGNDRGEISFNTLHIPVIAIGIPTIVDAATIVSNTFNLMLQKFSYTLNNKKASSKLVTSRMLDYRGDLNELSDNDKNNFIGLLGNLSEEEFKELIYEVLLPVDANLMVTPKEIDYLIDKLSLLIGTGINKCLHPSFNTTK